jgi:two-component system, OmpR family, phosphate regulon response regulator OmpR
VKPLPPMQPAPSSAPMILVVDDDRRVVELLQIALTAHGFRVATAGDGEEAVRRALSERPDLIVLDVRLPKKSGLEVCEMLRQDPDDPYVPIVMVSAVAETDARLQGLARGADDYLTKPFSPKELIARIKRLLIRNADARESRERRRTAELELTRAREEIQRVHRDLRREQRLRDLALAFGRDLHRTLDPDELSRRILTSAHSRLGAETVALLRSDGEGRLVPSTVLGDGFERIDDLIVPVAGELMSVLAGLGRPARREELERLSELREGVAPFVARGFTLLAPLCDSSGLEALLIADERADGRDAEPQDLETLATLCELGAIALGNARRAWAQAEGRVEELAARARMERPDVSEECERDALALVAGAAAGLGLPPRERTLVAAGVPLVTWAATESGRSALCAAGASDPTSLLAELAALCSPDAEPATLERSRAHSLLTVAASYLVARGHGVSADEALAVALAHDAIESPVAEALNQSARNRASLAGTTR